MVRENDRLSYKGKSRMIQALKLLLLCAILLAAGGFGVNSQSVWGRTVLVAGSDYQGKNNEVSAKTVTSILNAMKNSGYERADGMLFVGDYTIIYDGLTLEDTEAGIASLRSAAASVFPTLDETNVVLSSGNHEKYFTSSYSASGAHEFAEYSVFVINEDDFKWNMDNDEGADIQAIAKNTANNLKNYLNGKISQQYDHPIFVLCHVPIHYEGKTAEREDGIYGKYLFHVMNEAGAAGLNIFFLYGHIHSGSADDPNGGSAVFLTKGDPILIPNFSRESYTQETLKFTYMNAGYTGYYSGGNDTTLTMTLFDIDGNKVVVKRYDSYGLHNLKSAGRTITQSGYTIPKNSLVYQSPQTVIPLAASEWEQIEGIGEETETQEGEITTYTVSAQSLPVGTAILGKSVTGSAQYAKGDVVTLRAETSARGYVFSGWYEQLGGDRIKICDYATFQFSMKCMDRVFVAMWEKAVYAVRLDPNGGEMPEDISIEVTYGEPYGELPVPVRDGYEFQGWFEESAGGKQIFADSIMKRLSDHSIYAHWEETEPETEAGSEPESEPESEREPVTEIEPESETEHEPVTEIKPMTEAEPATETQPAAKPETEAVPSQTEKPEQTNPDTTSPDITLPVQPSNGVSMPANELTKGMTAQLKKTAYTYTGKAIKPAVKSIKINKKPVSVKNFGVTYKNNKNAGFGQVRLTGKGKYKKYRAILYFKINLKKAELSSVKAKGNGALAVKWKADGQAKGYKVQYSTNKKFQKGKTITVNGQNKTSCTIKNLTRKKTYYVRIRSFRKINGAIWYGSWSSVKHAKTK